MASSTHHQMLQPTHYGGHGKMEGGAFGGLIDRAFSARCPPVITRDTTIIAVCGPNDHEDNASPTKDGWFFSDFYLFHHLFRDTAKEQHWLTCVDPYHLVRKYTELAHGDPRSDDRRVVLDSTMKEDVSDVTVVHAKDLLDRFLSYVTHACKDVRGTDNPVLVLVFGHGSSKTFSITIGGSGSFETCPKLTRQKFNQAVLRHNPNANLSMMTTACFGGGWVQSSFLNITAMAGVNSQEELLSWPESISLGRCCGSRYATGVVRALIQMEIEELDLDEEDVDVCSSPTYVALVRSVHDTLVNNIDVRESNFISFSAKDDVWDMQWRARTGFPLAGYEMKWKALRLLDRGSTTGNSLSASVRFSDSINLSTPEAEFRVKRLASEYLSSYPGPDAAAKNHHIHGRCRDLLRGVQVSDENLERLAGALRYRLITIMDRATEYKDRLGIYFEDCRACNTENRKAVISRDNQKSPKYSKIFDMVTSYQLFDDPAAHESMEYMKGTYYLTVLFTESGWDKQLVEDGLKQLAKIQTQSGKYHLTVRTLKIWDQKSTRDMLGTIARSTKKRLRSLSPIKHQRKSLEGVFGGR